MTGKRFANYFDGSTFAALALFAAVLISLPGGCWSSDDVENEDEPAVETGAEPTAPPMMEIVEAETGSSDTLSPIAPEQSEDDSMQDGQPPPVEQPDDGTYIVQPNDTLFGIAVRFNVSIEALQEENGISDPNSLQVGQILRIPR